MAKGVAALYDDLMDAQQAIQDLVNNGITRESISIVSSNAAGQHSAEVGEKESEVLLKGSTVGSIAGGLAGMVAGLAALAIPGIGPVVAAGPLLAFFGATAGSVAGGFIGAFADWDIQDNEAEFYAEGVRRGGTLVAVKAEGEDNARAATILKRHNPVDMNERMALWRASGWTRFDPKAKPYTADEVARERASYPPMRTSIAAEEGEKSPLMPGKPGVPTIEEQDAAFRDHYRTTFARSGHDYNYYLPAYRFGYNLATDDRYADKDWTAIEPELRRFWEDYTPGSWDTFKEAIRFGRRTAPGRR